MVRNIDNLWDIVFVICIGNMHWKYVWILYEK